MEILVILMLATVFFAIAMFIVSFIMVKKHHTDKVYEKGSNNLDLEDDDDDDNMESNVVNEDNVNENKDNVDSNEINSKEEKVDEIIQEEPVSMNEFDKKDELVGKMVVDVVEEIEETPVIEETKDVIDNSSSDKMIDIIVPKVEVQENKETVPNVETDMQEVVNVLINKKNYMFLANGNKVSKGEHIKLVLNKKIYFGLITKGNYMRDIKSLKSKPHKLIVIKNNKTKKEEIEVLDTSDLEFIPKRKSQN